MVSYDLFPFMLKIKTSTRGTNSMPFLVFRQDQLQSTSGIIYGSGSFAVVYRRGKKKNRNTQSQKKKFGSCACACLCT